MYSFAIWTCDQILSCYGSHLGFLTVKENISTEHSSQVFLQMVSVFSNDNYLNIFTGSYICILNMSNVICLLWQPSLIIDWNKKLLSMGSIKFRISEKKNYHFPFWVYAKTWWIGGGHIGFPIDKKYTFERAIKGAYLPCNNSISHVVSEMRMRKHNWPNNTAEFVNKTKSTDNVEKIIR